ncbi:hypothetical protein BD413DRAFT_625700 [Trametes elegans]|nr:hypothetical protein BD413DRAFT_625700 [Trametes elegans]
MGRSYGVIGQGDPDNEDGTAEDEDDRTVYSDVELASGDSGDDGYAYGGIPAAYEFVDPEIPCVVPAVASAPMSPGEEQLLHHSMAHPWVVPPYNAPERSRRSARESTWRSLEATLGAVVASALLLPFGAGFMVIDIGSFGVGSFGLLMIAVVDFAFRAGAASLNRRRVDNVTKNSPIAKGYETYTTLPRMNRPRLPECSITVVGYRENQQLWEDCLESIKAQQYPVKHIVSVIDGNDPADMAMATTFANAFPEKDRLVVHLPVLLSVLYVDKYNDTLRILGQVPTRFESFKAWMTGQPTAGHTAAHESALNYVLDYLYTKAAIGKWSHHKALCFTQPHAHKRHAMFTGFFVGTYVLGTKDALLTTDSDTRLEPSAASNLMAMLFTEDDIAAVTGDVDVDRRASLLPNVYALNNWFASNVDSPCQSFFGSVSRLSSPMALYRVSDLMEVVSPWIMQTHFGREATTGEDRHLATLLLSRGLKTAHTHAAKAFTDAPGKYVRWVKQQTRWSRATYREGLFSSPRVNSSNPWLTIEAITALYYPAVLMASMLYLLFTPHQWEHLVIWLSTVGAAVVLKTVYAAIVGRDVRLLLYPLNKVLFFLGVVPTRVWALLTTHSKKWGTSARSTHEISRSESFLSRTAHIGHLLVWYTALSVGLGYYLATALAKPALWAVALVGLVPALHAYADVVFAKFNFFIFAPRHIQQGRTKVSDVEAYPHTGAKRRFSVPKLSLKRVGRGSVVSDEQFEEDMAAIPLNPTKKDGSLFGEASVTVFEAPDSRRPSLFTAVTDGTASTSPSPVTPLPLAVPELPFRKPACSPALDVQYGEAL